VTQDPYNPSDAAYLTAITWPEGLDRTQIAELIAGTGVLDRHTAHMLAARELPIILGQFDRASARRTAAAIGKAGGDAFAPTMAQIARLGPSMKIKEMKLTGGNLDVDIWRGLSTTIRREHIQFLVRGHIRGQESEAQRNRRIADKVRADVADHTRAFRYGWYVRQNAENVIDSMNEGNWDSTHDRHVLDIHTTAGTVFQVDGDKFAYTILGEMKQYSDKANMDRLCELISHIAPNDVVDDYFRLFRPPPGHRRLFQLVPELRKTGDDPNFAFYSRWSALLYRHVMGLTTS